MTGGACRWVRDRRHSVMVGNFGDYGGSSTRRRRRKGRSVMVGPRFLPVIAVTLGTLASGCAGGSVGPEDQLGCMRTIVEDHERVAAQAADDLRHAASQLPGDQHAQKRVAARLRDVAQKISNAGGGCA